jgi:hypothetical protein
MFEVLKDGLDALKGIEPKQFELLKNWFVNIVIRDMDESNVDKFKKIIQESMVLCKACLKYGVGKFVFSSSATVYG